ncbi:NUDIX hydrolase domain-like protein [Aspergillus navahoensis]
MTEGMQVNWSNLNLIYNSFVQFYTQLGTQPDALGLTWTQEELEELGHVYADVAAGSDIKQHLSGYPTDPASAVASVLPRISAKDIIRHDESPPIISRSKQLVAIDQEPCSVRVSILVVSYRRGIFIMQRDQEDSFGGEWEFPGGQVNAGERVSEGGVRELREETGLEGEMRLHSFDIWYGRKDGRRWYQFNCSAEVEGNEPGWERRIRLSEEHQGFAWMNGMEWSKFALGREKNILEGLRSYLNDRL